MTDASKRQMPKTHEKTGKTRLQVWIEPQVWERINEVVHSDFDNSQEAYLEACSTMPLMKVDSQVSRDYQDLLDAKYAGNINEFLKDAVKALSTGIYEDVHKVVKALKAYNSTKEIIEERVMITFSLLSELVGKQHKDVILKYMKAHKESLHEYHLSIDIKPSQRWNGRYPLKQEELSENARSIPGLSNSPIDRLLEELDKYRLATPYLA